MLGSHSAELQVTKLLQGLSQSPLPDYLAEQCSDSTTNGRFCEPCVQLKAVDAQLVSYLEEVNKLLRLKVALTGRLNQHHDRLTRRLPVEIVSYIFSIYTEGVNSSFDLGDPIVESGPLLLGSVSKSWRRIAFSTPHLWNTVNINMFLDDNLPMKVELTKEWLDRSRQLPLHLTVVCESLLRRLTPISRSDLTHTDRLLPRLESLEFKGYKAFSWSRLASLVSATTSELDGGPNFPIRPECTTSIRRISFNLYETDAEIDCVDPQSLAHFKRAQEAGTFHCQAMDRFGDRVRGRMFMF